MDPALTPGALSTSQDYSLDGMPGYYVAPGAYAVKNPPTRVFFRK